MLRVRTLRFYGGEGIICVLFVYHFLITASNSSTFLAKKYFWSTMTGKEWGVEKEEHVAQGPTWVRTDTVCGLNETSFCVKRAKCWPVKWVFMCQWITIYAVYTGHHKTASPLEWLAALLRGHIYKQVNLFWGLPSLQVIVYPFAN